MEQIKVIGLDIAKYVFQARSRVGRCPGMRLFNGARLIENILILVMFSVKE
jgi:hypothetical protein